MTTAVAAVRGRGATRTVAVVVLLLVLAAAQVGAQRSFQKAWPHRGYEELLYLPSGRHLKAFTLGFADFGADLLWIEAISYFGGHALTDREYPWLFHILDQISTLDPLFANCYSFGGVVLAVERASAEESIAILAKGMANYPGDWRFPFYIGYNIFYNQRDAEGGARFMRYAASLPGSPAYLSRLAASLTAESGRLAAAIRFLETMAEATPDESARASIRNKIEELRAGRVPEALKSFLAGERAP